MVGWLVGSFVRWFIWCGFGAAAATAAAVY